MTLDDVLREHRQQIELQRLWEATNDAGREKVLAFMRMGLATNTAIPPLSWVLSVPRGVRAELRIVGKDVTKGDLQRLKQQIDFLVESFEDGVERFASSLR